MAPAIFGSRTTAARMSRFAPDGTVRRVIPMPVKNVTSVAIGDGTLYITTARDASDRGAERGGSLFAVALATESSADGK
jgi:sugar lactone lactonase YvrE